MMKEFKPDQLSVLERNSDCWEMGADGKPAPYLDEVRYIQFGDTSATRAAFVSDQLRSAGAPDKELLGA